MTPSFSVALVSWDTHGDRLSEIRRLVFIEEQKVPPELEMDGRDGDACQAVALDGGGATIGTARLLPDGSIGRVAVLQSWRNRGVGRELMRLLIEFAAKRGDPELTLHAQVQTVPFYESLGFACEGEVYEEAGIPHRTMRLKL